MAGVVLIGVTAALGFVALGLGVFIVGTRLDYVEKNKQGVMS
jgi:hypothetical protein